MNLPGGLRLFHLRPGDPDFLDLPWDRPLAAWPGDCSRIVDMPRGLSRHDVVFVAYDKRVYALKELPVAIGIWPVILGSTCGHPAVGATVAAASTTSSADTARHAGPGRRGRERCACRMP